MRINLNPGGAGVEALCFSRRKADHTLPAHREDQIEEFEEEDRIEDFDDSRPEVRMLEVWTPCSAPYPVPVRICC